MKLIKLAVLPVVPLPHIITSRGVKYIFSPVAEVPEEYAAQLLKTYPGRFTDKIDKVKVEEYEFTDSYKNRQLQDIVDMLPDEMKLDVFKYAISLLEKQTGQQKDAEAAALAKKVEEQKKVQAQEQRDRKKRDEAAREKAIAEKAAREKAAREKAAKEKKGGKGKPGSGGEPPTDSAGGQ